MLTELITKIAIYILDTTGYFGAAFLMALESMIAPVPSEAVMPFVGFQVADGKWSLIPSIVATSIGSITGSLISYLIGYYGGKPFVLKVGKYLLLNKNDLEKTERFFHARKGTITLFLSRFIPVVRHFISIPAGTGKMPLIPFIIATLIGATMWNSFLLFCGMKLREHWMIVQRYSHQIDVFIVLGMLVTIIIFIKKRIKERGAKI
ncbi:MAG: DedA family protein [Verrucomicrobiia bacterium]